MQKLYFGVKLYSKQIVNFAGTGHPKKVACRNEKILSDTDCAVSINGGISFNLDYCIM